MRKAKHKKRKPLASFLSTVLTLVILGAAVVAGINLWTIVSVQDKILTEETAAKLEDIDCIIVLGCSVHSDGTPSHMLEDRLKRGVALYHAGAAPKILMSGDHGTEHYDEVSTMKRYAVEAGIPSEDVFMDHAGFSTYETVYRAKEIFGAKKILIVTQQYHLYRAMYIAQAMDLEVYGVAADYRQYSGQFARDVREVLARVKDFGMTIFWPEPTYLGEPIPISGSGELTHDAQSDFS
jgi:vancomycin permeability regulator SanA